MIQLTFMKVVGTDCIFESFEYMLGLTLPSRVILVQGSTSVYKNYNTSVLLFICAGHVQSRRYLYVVLPMGHTHPLGPLTTDN